MSYRFHLNVVMAFVTAFVIGSWAIRGFPMRSSGPVQFRELTPTADMAFGDMRETDEMRRRREAIAVAERVSDPALDRIRLDTLQAANAYALSPCDTTMKANLIKALTTYVEAWQRVLQCPGPRMFCSQANMFRATTTFATSLDNRIREALGKAFAQKGIVMADFPSALHLDVSYFSGPNLWSNESRVCAALEAPSDRRR